MSTLAAAAAPTWSTPAVTASSTSVKFTFTTNEPADRYTSYGLTPSLGTTQTYVARALTSHSATISGLAPSTTYYVQFRLVGASGESALTPIYTARTLADGSAPTVTVDRSMYPNGTGVWAHLPAWQQWPAMYWVPEGSSFVAPRGERVHKGRFLGLQPTENYRIYFPESFENVERGLNINGGNFILFGPEIRNTRWIGRSGIMVASSSADAEAGINLTPPRPGKTYLKDYTKAAPSDANRGMLINGNATATSARTFRAIEGMYLAGDWIFEGLDYNRKSDSNTDLVIQNFRHDRVSVCYSKHSSGSYTEKSGGDAFQAFDNGQPTRMWINGFSVPASSIQGIFMGAGSGLQLFSARRVLLKGASPTSVYGPSAYLWWNTHYSTTRIAEDVHVVPSPGRTREQTVWENNGPAWPTITATDGPDPVPASEVGRAYPLAPAP